VSDITALALRIQAEATLVVRHVSPGVAPHDSGSNFGHRPECTEPPVSDGPVRHGSNPQPEPSRVACSGFQGGAVIGERAYRRRQAQTGARRWTRTGEWRQGLNLACLLFVVARKRGPLTRVKSTDHRQKATIIANALAAVANVPICLELAITPRIFFCYCLDGSMDRASSDLTYCSRNE